MNIFDPSYMDTSKGGEMLVYHVPTGTEGNVFLGVSTLKRTTLCTAHAVEGATVIWVIAERLLELWRLDPNPDIREQICAFGNVQTWESDRKFQLRYSDFSKNFKSSAYPGLLSIWNISSRQRKNLQVDSKISIKENLHDLFVTPKDGITRTLWLLVAGAKQFPIVVQSLNDANLIFKYAGIPGHPPQLIVDLWGKFGRSVDETK